MHLFSSAHLWEPVAQIFKLKIVGPINVSSRETGPLCKLKSGMCFRVASARSRIKLNWKFLDGCKCPQLEKKVLNSGRDEFEGALFYV